VTFAAREFRLTGMRALDIRHPEVTRERLLALAEDFPGAWLGIKIAVLVLLSSLARCSLRCPRFYFL